MNQHRLLLNVSGYFRNHRGVVQSLQRALPRGDDAAEEVI
jgi:hypothetical protein